MFNQPRHCLNYATSLFPVLRDAPQTIIVQIAQQKSNKPHHPKISASYQRRNAIKTLVQIKQGNDKSLALRARLSRNVGQAVSVEQANQQLPNKCR